jgi:hypothetical protein
MTQELGKKGEPLYLNSIPTEQVKLHITVGVLP